MMPEAFSFHLEFFTLKAKKLLKNYEKDKNKNIEEHFCYHNN
jgi:hypothetical protein